jgi:alpha-tubulin suppressor-like RCC1 family protein
MLHRKARRSGVLVAGVLAGAALLAGCDTGPTAPPVGPSLAISDGAHFGNPHFFFLPSMVPKMPSTSGTFDGSLSPEVQICVWDGTTCTLTLVLFNMDVGYRSETIRVNEADEHYVVNWHTDELLDTYPLAAGEVFRVRVLLEDHELGFADIAVVGGGKGIRSVNRESFVPLKDGRTLPIKFRIEEGARSEATDQQQQPGGGASAGLSHSCAVASDGQAYCWGANHRGQLGNGTAGGTFDTPQLVAGGLSWQAVEASKVYTCGLTTDGQVYCWGSNTFGELGIGTRDFLTHPVPEPVTGGHTFQSLASLGTTDSQSTCAVTTGGDMYCWGSNASGQLGIGAVTFVEPAPTLVTGGHEFAGPAALGRRVACGVTTGGQILCWGLNDFGQLGRGYTTSFFSPEPWPEPVLGDHVFEAVAVGSMHACAIDATQAAWCWGRNFDGELGLGTTLPGRLPTPQPVTGGHLFAQVNAGWVFSCGVDATGQGFCWGQNQYGQLGRGFKGGPDQPMPGLVVGDHSFRAISTGRQHACGITTTGETYCWGDGASGQLGNGSTTATSTPDFTMDLDPTSSP